MTASQSKAEQVPQKEIIPLACRVLPCFRGRMIDAERDAKFEAVTTLSTELAKELRASIDKTGEFKDRRTFSEYSGMNPLTILHYRGTQDEFNLGARYCENADPLDRVAGTLILAQLGFSKGGTWVTESVDILLRLLQDEDLRVVGNAATALGHRRDARAVPHLVNLADHPDENVRRNVVFGLLTQEAPEAINCLIRLSRDPDRDVRDWAVFGLGSQLEDVDTPEIRQALFEALDEPDEEIQGEAIVGLAERGDMRVVPAILKRWQAMGEPYGLDLEAAFLVGDPSFIPPLEKLLSEMDGDGSADWIEKSPDWATYHPRWRQEVIDALRRCRGEISRYHEPLGPDGLPIEEPHPD